MNKVIDKKTWRTDYRDCRDKSDQRAHEDVIVMSIKSQKNSRILTSHQKCDARSNQFHRDALPRGRNDRVWLCARSSDGFSCITASIAAIRCRVCRRSEMLGATPGRDVPGGIGASSLAIQQMRFLGSGRGGCVQAGPFDEPYL
jgi:hypothetical protein